MKFSGSTPTRTPGRSSACDDAHYSGAHRICLATGASRNGPPLIHPQLSPMTWRPRLLLLALLLLALLSLLLSLTNGTVSTDWHDLLALYRGNADSITAQVILELRWPRSAAAFTTGGLLALAGSLMQVLLRNPLADPYVLGVSGGAASGALD